MNFDFRWVGEHGHETLAAAPIQDLNLEEIPREHQFTGPVGMDRLLPRGHRAERVALRIPTSMNRSASLPSTTTLNG